MSKGEHGFVSPKRSAEHGFTSRKRSAENGFTLIEMLVALAVFGLAALALLRLEGVTVTSAARLEEDLLARIVARNQGVEALTGAAAPALGTSSGTVANGGRRWGWTRRVARADDGGLLRIDIAVADAEGSPAATLTLFRRGR